MRETWGRNTAAENIPPCPEGRCHEVVVKDWETWNLRRPVRMPYEYGYCSYKATVGDYCRRHANKRGK